MPGSRDNPLLTITGVTKQFTSRERDRAAVTAFEEISLDVMSGETVTIVGASGCGKTSLLRCVAGLESLTSGRIDLRSDGDQRGRAEVAMVFQRDSLFPWRTIESNVALGLEIVGVGGQERADRVAEALRLVRLSRWARNHPHELSGGMRQRVNIARALVARPRLLLMDEPFAALDAQTREVMQAELRRLISELGITVLFVTHQIDEAVYLGDRVVVLSSSPGRVQTVVTPDLPRPRTSEVKRSAGFVDITQGIWSLIASDVSKALDGELQQT